MRIRKIAVAGATGNLGRPVTRVLLDAGYDVTILARTPDAARARFPDARVVEADLYDAGAVRRALAGQDAVYLSLSVPPGERRGARHTETDGVRNVVAAARAERVGRIALLSSLVQRYQGTDGFRWWVFDVKQEAVRLVRESGVHYTIFYPSTFMDNFTSTYRQGERLLLLGRSRHPMFFIAGRDYGAQVARSFEVVPPDENREYVVQGPEAYLEHEAAHLFAAEHPAPVRVVQIPLPVLRTAGLVVPAARYAARIGEALNQYPESFEAERTWAELGAPRTTLSDFARAADA